MKYSDIPVRPANRAKVHRTTNWPAEKRSCLFLSFDFDAETAWFDEDPAVWRNVVSVSHDGFGARVGVPKMLELLGEFRLSATFFVPGWVAVAHTAICEDILKAGHEIGHHGGFHIKPDTDDEETSLREIEHGFASLKSALGVEPIGYSAPAGENVGVFLDYLQARGIRYSSSWRDDVFPYRHVLEGGKAGPLELPANYFFDDWMHGLIKGSGRNLVAREQVLSMWMDELEETHEWGGLTTTIFHPQVSGRPSRYRILRQFLEQALALDGLWIANGSQICNHLEATDSFKAGC
jgi:peptidoglycan/xylan/chitin deacetylase (PgdA/CDA1 family)